MRCNVASAMVTEVLRGGFIRSNGSVRQLAEGRVFIVIYKK